MNLHNMVQSPGISRVVFNRRVGPGWYVLRLEERAIAERARPGQFVQVRCHDGASCDPLLRRPFSVYRTDPQAGTYDLIYVTVGRGTEWMARIADPPQPGAGIDGGVDVEGPFGNTFSAPAEGDRIYLVAGGVGIAPLYFFARELLTRGTRCSITLCMGARTREGLQGIDEFRALPIRCETATDDGSDGFHGRVTELLAALLDAEAAPQLVRVYGCGPQGMNESLRRLAIERDTFCEICLESLMACGFGICFGCVAPIRRELGGEFFNRRICWEGPVFDARLLCPGIDGGAGH